MATYTSDQYINGQSPSPTMMSAVPMRAYVKFAASTALAVGDVILLAKIAPAYGVSMADIDTDALTGLSVNAGVLNAALTTVSTASHNAVSLATAGIVLPNRADLHRMMLTEDVRSFGFVVTAAATVPANTIIGVNLMLRPRHPVE
jgi:hypothetical protein